MSRRALTWLGWSAAAALGVAALAWLFVPAPVGVDTAVVAQAPFERTVDEEARTRVRERYVVAAPLAGRLLRIALKPGDAVAADTPVATLVPSYPSLLDARAEQELTERVGAAEARLTAAAAAVERAEASRALARSDAQRMQDLAARGFVSQQVRERTEREAEVREKELAAARYDYHAVEHDLAVARAALLFARQPARGAGARFAIPSPVAGRVLRVAQESETIVAVGTPLVEIGDPAALEVVADVLTTDAESIAPGNPVELARGRGEPLRGRVRLVEPAAFTKVSALGIEEQRTHVVMDLVTPADQWRDLGDAYRLDAHIVVDALPQALVVPTAALFRVDGGWAAFVVSGGRAQRRDVRIGPRNAKAAVVLAGLGAGDVVVLYPGSAVRDGTRVRAR